MTHLGSETKVMQNHGAARNMPPAVLEGEHKEQIINLEYGREEGNGAVHIGPTEHHNSHMIQGVLTSYSDGLMMMSTSLMVLTLANVATVLAAVFRQMMVVLSARALRKLVKELTVACLEQDLEKVVAKRGQQVCGTANRHTWPLCLQSALSAVAAYAIAGVIPLFAGSFVGTFMYYLTAVIVSASFANAALGIFVAGLGQVPMMKVAIMCFLGAILSLLLLLGIFCAFLT